MPLPDQSERDDQVWAWLERRYREHGRQLQLFALGVLGSREDAEDATQIALLKAHRALSKGDRPSRPRAWLFAITLNVCRRVLRARARGAPAALDGELRAVARDPDIPTGAEISRALRALSPEQREIFLLREVRGLSYAELSERLELTPAAVGSLLARARKGVREQLAVPEERAGKRPLVALPGVWTTLRDALQPSALKVAGLVGAAAVAPGIAIGLYGAVPNQASADQVPGATSAPVSRLAAAPAVQGRPDMAALAAAPVWRPRGSPAHVTRRSAPARTGSSDGPVVPPSAGQTTPAVDPAPARAVDASAELPATGVKHPHEAPSASAPDEVELTDEVDEAVERAKETVGELVSTDQLPTVPEPPPVDQPVETVGDAVPDLPEVSPPKLPTVP